MFAVRYGRNDGQPMWFSNTFHTALEGARQVAKESSIRDPQLRYEIMEVTYREHGPTYFLQLYDGDKSMVYDGTFRSEEEAKQRAKEYMHVNRHWTTYSIHRSRRLNVSD